MKNGGPTSTRARRCSASARLRDGLRALGASHMNGDRETFTALYATAHLSAPLRRGRRAHVRPAARSATRILFAMLTDRPEGRHLMRAYFIQLLARTAAHGPWPCSAHHLARELPRAGPGHGAWPDRARCSAAAPRRSDTAIAVMLVIVRFVTVVLVPAHARLVHDSPMAYVLVGRSGRRTTSSTSDGAPGATCAEQPGASRRSRWSQKMLEISARHAECSGDLDMTVKRTFGLVALVVGRMIAAEAEGHACSPVLPDPSPALTSAELVMTPPPGEERRYPDRGPLHRPALGRARARGIVVTVRSGTTELAGSGAPRVVWCVVLSLETGGRCDPCGGAHGNPRGRGPDTGDLDHHGRGPHRAIPPTGATIAVSRSIVEDEQAPTITCSRTRGSASAARGSTTRRSRPTGSACQRGGDALPGPDGTSPVQIANRDLRTRSQRHEEPGAELHVFAVEHHLRPPRSRLTTSTASPPTTTLLGLPDASVTTTCASPRVDLSVSNDEAVAKIRRRTTSCDSTVTRPARRRTIRRARRRLLDRPPPGPRAHDGGSRSCWGALVLGRAEAPGGSLPRDRRGGGPRGCSSSSGPSAMRKSVRRVSLARARGCEIGDAKTELCGPPRWLKRGRPRANDPPRSRPVDRGGGTGPPPEWRPRGSLPARASAARAPSSFGGPACAGLRLPGARARFARARRSASAAFAPGSNAATTGRCRARRPRRSGGRRTASMRAMSA